ncbi:MAG TPA: hypothetical protein VFL12_04275, partial [Thermoanaerobaculia bacterium]|nr:hypothetical protein [Thermoanaerobaculia bacterium]
AGHPESAALGAAFALLWVVSRLLSRSWSSPAAVVRSGAFAAVLALGLSAPLLLPQLDAIRASNRRVRAEESLAIVATLSHPHRPWWTPALVTPFFPRAYGDGIGAPMQPAAVYSFPELSSACVGGAAWLLVFLTLRPGSKRRPETLGLVVIAGLAILITVRSWPAIEVLARVPELGVMITVRFQAWIALAAAALAAFEFDRWRRDCGEKPRRALWITAAAAGYAAAGTALLVRHGRADASGFALLMLALAGVATAGAAAALVPIPPRARETIVFAALVCAAIGELFGTAIPLDRFGPARAVFPPTPLVDFLRSRPGGFRVAGIGTSLFPASSVFAGVEDVRTHDPLERRDYLRYLDAAAGYSPAEYFKKLENPDAPALDLLNVGWVVAPPGGAPPGPHWERVYAGNDGTVFRNPSVLPRVWAPAAVRPVGPAPAGHPEDAFAAFGLEPAEIVRRTSEGRETLVVSDGPAPLPERLRGGPTPVVRDVRESANAIGFTAELAGPLPAVVVASVVQDGGWGARDEIGALATGRANGPFLAIAVRPGRHRVRLEYAPPGLASGVAAAAAAALAGIGALLISRNRARVSAAP